MSGVRTSSGLDLQSITHSPAPTLASAEASGLWERGTYGTPMSKALGNLTTVETIYGEDGKRLFDAFKLKPEQKGDN